MELLRRSGFLQGLSAACCLFMAGCVYDSIDNQYAAMAPERRAPWLIHRLKYGPERGDAAMILGRTGDERAVEPLIRALRDRDVHVRGRAARSLGMLGDDRAVEPLIEALRDDGYGRGWVAEALGKLGDPRAVEPLVSLLDNASPYREWQAAEALGRLGDRRAVDPLIRKLSHNHAPMRAAAAHALAEIGDRSAVPALVRALDDSDWSTLDDPRFRRVIVSSTAAHALGRLEAVEELVRALQHRNPLVREAAAFELGRLVSDAAIPALIAQGGDADALVRDAVIEALGRFDDPRAIDAVRAATSDPCPLVARTAAKALAEHSPAIGSAPH